RSSASLRKASSPRHPAWPATVRASYKTTCVIGVPATPTAYPPLRRSRKATKPTNSTVISPRAIRRVLTAAEHAKARKTADRPTLRGALLQGGADPKDPGATTHGNSVTQPNALVIPRPVATPTRIKTPTTAGPIRQRSFPCKVCILSCPANVQRCGSAHTFSRCRAPGREKPGDVLGKCLQIGLQIGIGQLRHARRRRGRSGRPGDRSLNGGRAGRVSKGDRDEQPGGSHG